MGGTRAVVDHQDPGLGQVLAQVLDEPDETVVGLEGGHEHEHGGHCTRPDKG